MTWFDLALIVTGLGLCVGIGVAMTPSPPKYEWTELGDAWCYTYGAPDGGVVLAYVFAAEGRWVARDERSGEHAYFSTLKSAMLFVEQEFAR